MLFMGVLALLFGAAYIGGALGVTSTWTFVFGIGASASASYLVMSLLALSEKTRTHVLFVSMTRRSIFLATIYVPILAGFFYWIYTVGSVQALPILPYFIGIFYAWILAQAYFIANPITHSMVRFESRLAGQGTFKKIARILGTTILFLPIAPLGFGIWEISSWARQNYANISGSDNYILAWTIIVAVLLVATSSVVVKWGWKNIRNGRSEVSVFAGGTFLIVWGYLLYRAATTLISVITQNQPSFPAIDIGLMIISILGAMQTFARKTINLADRRWSQALPFLVFSFGSVYAVAQYYFILQGGLTRAALSAIVSGTVFAVGTLTLMLLLRSHLKMESKTTSSNANSTHETEEPQAAAPVEPSDSVEANTSPTRQEASNIEEATDSDNSADTEPAN